MPAAAGAGTGKRVVVVGFYGRANLGDELFKCCFDWLLSGARVSYVCIDDFTSIPDGTDVLVLGGGDVVNKYFCERFHQRARGFEGPKYALGVGIPYDDDASLLSGFDHVVARSQRDFALARAVVGAPNVTYLPDLLFSLFPPAPTPRPLPPPPRRASIAPPASPPRGASASWTGIPRSPTSSLPRSPVRLDTRPPVVGVALAQPAFWRNDVDMIGEACALASALAVTCGARVQLMSFNTSPTSRRESDTLLNSNIQRRCEELGVSVSVLPPSQTSSLTGANRAFERLDAIVAMRFHSVVLALATGTPVVPLYCSSKVDSLVSDAGLTQLAVRLPVDDEGRPTTLSIPAVIRGVDCALARGRARVVGHVPLVRGKRADYSLVRRMVFGGARAQQPIPPPPPRAYEAALDDLVRMLAQLTGTDAARVRAMGSGQEQLRDLCGDNAGIDAAARMVSFAFTGRVTSAYVYGTIERIRNGHFHLLDDTRWLWSDFQAKPVAPRWLPPLPLHAQCSIDMSYMHQDWSGAHRSGWAYVCSGLMHLDASVTGRPAQLQVDTCLERTFLWGAPALEAARTIPYRRPWLGVLHHTFHSANSPNDLRALFATPTFLASLAHCKGLVCLSEYLARQVRDHMAARALPAVPVHVLRHPIDTDVPRFSMARFRGNADRRVVQIGAWLRDPYAIYDLPVPAEGNKIGLRKAALKGREMDSYFRPSDFGAHEDRLRAAYQVPGPNACQSPVGVSRAGHQDHDGGNGLCRARAVADVQGDPIVYNKYVNGLLSCLARNDASVRVIQHLGNAAYDELMSSNVVFLKLEDV